MPIYEVRGFQQKNLYLNARAEPFTYIETFPPVVVPQGGDLQDFKQTSAPYCISGTIKAETTGTYKRNNETLLTRDLVFIDYDDIRESAEIFINKVTNALEPFSFVLYPTIKHTETAPRFRLVVNPSEPMNKGEYFATVKEITNRIGYPFDPASFTWSQLQGLPVTTGKKEDYRKIINKGACYPVVTEKGASQRPPRTDKSYIKAGSKTAPWEMIELILYGLGGKGGRNIALTRLTGWLLSKGGGCTPSKAYEYITKANSNTPEPLPEKEVERTFRSIYSKEIRKVKK